MDVRVGLWRKLSTKELMLFNWCWRRLLRVPWTARRSNQSFLKEISPGVLWKDWCWTWNSNTLATWFKELTHLKRPWSWERLRAGGKGDDREWDGWMASLTQWTWVWVDSGSWWWTGRPGMLRFMGSQRVGHDWMTELNWTDIVVYSVQNVCNYLIGTSQTLLIYCTSKDWDTGDFLKEIRCIWIPDRCFWFQDSWYSLFSISSECYWAIFELATNMLKRN